MTFVPSTSLPLGWAGAWRCEAAAGRESLAQTRGASGRAISRIWAYAKAHGFVIVSTDSDFFEMATTMGPPPKVVWLRRWTHPIRDAESVLRREAVRITQFCESPYLGVLVLDRE